MWSRFAVVVAFVGLLAGCGGGVSVSNVNGTANFAGSPIVFGEIEFIPNAALNHAGPAGSAEIVDGKFDTSTGGRGVVPGPHQLRITAYKSRPSGSEDETATVEQEPPLFVGYTIDMDVEGGTMTIDVPADAAGFNGMETQAKRRANDP